MMGENKQKKTERRVPEGFVQITKGQSSCNFYEDFKGLKILFNRDNGLLLNKKNKQFDDICKHFKSQGFVVNTEFMS